MDLGTIKIKSYVYFGIFICSMCVSNKKPTNNMHACTYIIWNSTLKKKIENNFRCIGKIFELHLNSKKRYIYTLKIKI